MIYCNAYECLHHDGDNWCTLDSIRIEETFSAEHPAACTDYEDKAEAKS